MYNFMYYKVKDVMISDPVTIGPEARLSEAAEMFEGNTFNMLPVVGENRKLLGVISKLDLLKAVYCRRGKHVPYFPTIARTRVSDVMTKLPEVVVPESSIVLVLEKMIETRNKSFPVVEDDQLVGIIAREDVLMAIWRSSQGTIPARLISPDLSGLTDPVSPTVA